MKISFLFLTLLFFIIGCSLLSSSRAKAEQEVKGGKGGSERSDVDAILFARCCSTDDTDRNQEDDTDCSEIDCSDSDGKKEQEVFSKIAKESHKEMDIDDHLRGERRLHKQELRKRMEEEAKGVSSLLSISSTMKSSVRNPGYRPHEKGIIKYMFNEKPRGWWIFGNKFFHSRFYKAMADWEKYTCVVFEEDKMATIRYVSSGILEGSSSHVGLSCREVRVSKKANLNTYRHELGHCLGLGHTSERADRDQYVTFNNRGCVDYFLKRNCNRKNILFYDKREAKIDRVFCRKTKNKDYLVATLSQKKYGSILDSTFNPREEDDIEKCVKGLCILGWISQYDINPVYSDHPSVSYDYASIMHYPWDKCLSPKKNHPQYDNTKRSERSNPGEKGIRRYDRDSLNALYGCLRIQVTYTHKGRFSSKGKAKTKHVFVHPKWTIQEALKYMARKLGLKKAFVGDIHKNGKNIVTNAKSKPVETLDSLGVKAGDHLTIVA